jgi:SEC-C motif-containing protein
MKMKISVNSSCPCGSGLKYKKCCAPFHKGALPKTALQLMRSRYCAFSAGDYKYIIKTTHEENPDFSEDKESWKESILQFCSSCSFQKLEIINFTDGENEAYVTFRASLLCKSKDSSFTEKSRFIKTNGMWRYHSGEFLQ